MSRERNLDTSANFDESGLILRGLQSACQLVIFDPSLKNVDTFTTICSSLDPLILGKFLREMLVPFGTNLYNIAKSDDISCNYLKCIFNILQKCAVTDIDCFINIYTLALRQLQDKNSPETVRNTSEELKIEVVKCVSQLIKSSSPAVRQKFLTREYYPKLSIGVFLCSLLAVNEKFISLRLEALNCLMLLIHVSDELPCDENFKKQLPNVLMLMVPGISSKCLKIVNDNETQNHKPIVLAIRLWSRMVAIVMSSVASEKMPITFSLQKLNIDDQNASPFTRSNSSGDFENAMKGMKHDRDWIKSTDKNLSSVTKRIANCQTHQHWRVRMELASAAFHLLESCSMNMTQSVGYLAEALTFLSQDENSKVNEFSKSCILKLRNKCETHSDRALVDIVEENFYSLLTRLPRILHGVDITYKEKELTLMCGFMDILGKQHVPAVLSSVQHLKRFLHCIILCATPDCSSISLMEDAALRGLDLSSYSTDAKWRHLKLCDSPKCETSLKSLCSKLVRYSDFEMLVNSLLDEFNTDPLYRKNILLLFIHLFSSGSSGDFQAYSALLKDVITAVMDVSLWNIPVVLNEDPSTKTAIQENIIQVCLLSELVGCLSVASGQAFSPLLLECLYPVLECAGSPLGIVSTAGQLSLQKLALLYEGGEVSTLIRNNVDYLSHHVMLKLRQAHRNPRVLSVLSVIMEYSSLKTLPSLHDIINDVLIQSCDMFQDINGSAFLHVFHTYLSCILKWTVKSSPPPKKEENHDKKLIIAELVEYNDALRAADIEANEPVDDHIDPSLFSREEESEQKTEDQVKIKLPDHIKLTKDILSRSLHFLPANNISRQILVLEIMNHGIEILSSWKDELLPVVHKIWSPLVERFKVSSHPLLLQRAFSLLKTLAQHSKDFIRVRTAKEVLPSLQKVLKDSSEQSKKRDPTGVYRMTQLYKLQLLLLTGLGKLALDIELSFKEAHKILISTSVYLSKKQPTPLQEACVELFKEISKVYPDIVWAHLMIVCPLQSELKAPLDELQDYKIECSEYNREEYLQNVEKIMTVV